MQFLITFLFLLGASVTAVQAASLNSSDRFKIESAKSLVRHHPRPKDYTLDTLCYRILDADRPRAKTVTKRVPISTKTRTRTSTHMAPTPVVTADTTSTVSTVTVTTQQTLISVQKREQRIDFSRLQTQCRDFKHDILNQACFELVYGGESPTITKTIHTSPKITTKTKTITITPSITSTVTPLATATTTTELPPVVASFSGISRAAPCSNDALNSARTSGDQSTSSSIGSELDCLKFCVSVPGCNFAIFAADTSNTCYAFQNLPSDALQQVGSSTCTAFQRGGGR